MSQISYNNTATLYLIPTPIGNLDDITLRAINILKEVEVIFCEDTRVTSLLMNHLGIKKSLIANHKFNEEKNEKRLLEYLNNGFSVGLVSDRGTPIMSDPGYVLANIAIANNYNVVSLPGPTAFVPALTSSGISPMPFLFYGFLNNKESKRKKELENLRKEKATLIFYESPHRIEKTLVNMYEILGNRRASISREISKKYEEIYRENLEKLIDTIVDIKGEMVVILEGNKEEEKYENQEIIEYVNDYINKGDSKKEAIKKVALNCNVNKNEVYRIYHEGE